MIKQVGTGNQQYIYTGQNGPIFGNGSNYAILAMGQTTELVLGADGIFPASGIQIELSYGFGSGGLTNATMTGGATQLYDIEVYQVTGKCQTYDIIIIHEHTTRCRARHDYHISSYWNWCSILCGQIALSSI
jgi:hypothetical protein